LIKLTINDRSVEVDDGTTVAAAILNSGAASFRTSVSDKRRGPLCGMGICFECRVTIDGIRHLRSCDRLVSEGMLVSTDE
jgi:sarcosine oxidase subunit alpha